MKRALVVIPLVAVAAAACGTTVEGVATAPSSTSVSTPAIPAGLDTGDFPTEPAAVRQSDGDTAWIAEGNRMLENIVLPSDVAPDLIAEVPGQEAAPALSNLDITSLPADLRTPLTKMKVGVSLARADRSGAAERELRIGLYRFDDEFGSGTALDSEGYALRSRRQVSLAGVTGGVAAETGAGTVDAFVATESLVVHVHARAKDTRAATDLAERALARQLPLLRGFTPTPPSELAALPLDQEGALRRTVAEAAPPRDSFRWIGALTVPMYERRVADPEGAQRLRSAGVDAIGWNVGRLFRARDEKAALNLRPDRAQSSTATPVGGVPQLGDAVGCYTRAGADPFCELVVGRYYVWIPASTVEFARQAAAAQWVILVRNP